MTSNQINYQKLLEDKRHNRATERETKRANLVQARHAREQLNVQSSYNESYLAHLSNNLRETGRHNLATESKDLLYLNRTMEETERHNRASEAISRQQISSNYDVAMANVNLGKQQLSENMRHNIRSEDLTARNNQYNYSLGQSKLGLEAQRNADLVRSDTQQQLLDMQKIKEVERHNVATERVSERQTTINALTNTSSQINQWYKSLTD